MPPKFAALFAAIGAACVLLSTLFGVSQFSDWLIFAAQGFLAVAVIVFMAYVIAGIVRDAKAM
jgi:hypothetical protein